MRRLQARYGDALDQELSIELLPSVAEDETASAASASQQLGRTGQALESGRYAHGREIARGGMGAILEVWDGDLARPLAMKVLLESQDPAKNTALVQRFVREARITGQLDHPGIVPVHDMGLDDEGRVYFTMRLVRGQELSQVFRDAATGTNDWNRARALEVLLKICDTVAYAHAHGVVHRDLKPMNVMVGSFGEVYVLDWGLAKILSADNPEAGPTTQPILNPGEDDIDATLVGVVLGTPSYMAPEQAAGDAYLAHPRLDVYALGALLYTLLLGRAPYVRDGERGSSREILEAVRSGPPAPLDAIAPGVPEDLAALCTRAMHRDPEQRFQSATEVADALRKHMELERQAAEESRRLRDQLADSNVVADFLKGLFRVDTPADAEKPVSILEILQRGAERIDTDLGDQQAMRASVHATLGEVLQSIGAHSDSHEHLMVAAQLAREHCATARHSGNPDETAAADTVLAHRITLLALTLYHTGAYNDAEELFLEAIALCRRLENREVLARALTGLMNAYWNTGRMKEAKPLLEEAVGLADALPTSIAHSNEVLYHGAVMEETGDIAAGEDALLAIVEARRKALGPDHPSIAGVLVNLTVLAAFRWDHALGVAHSREALRIRLKALGPKHNGVALVYANMGSALEKLGQLDEAEKLLQEAVEIRTDLYGPHHPNVAQALLIQGHAKTSREDFPAAEAFIDRAREIVQELGDEHPLHGFVQRALGGLRRQEGRFDEAEVALKRAVEIADRTNAPLHAQTLYDALRLADFYVHVGRHAEAEPILTRCQGVYAHSFRATDPVRVHCEELLATTHAALGQ